MKLRWEGKDGRYHARIGTLDFYVNALTGGASIAIVDEAQDIIMIDNTQPNTKTARTVAEGIARAITAEVTHRIYKVVGNA